MPDSRLRRWATPLAIAAAAVAAYAVTIGFGFVFDDAPLLLGSHALADGPLWRIWFTADAPDWIPLTWTSFWIERRLFHGAAGGHHATNVLLHATASVLLWHVLRRLRVPGAALGALLFAVHPVAVESVAWISERKNTLSAVFFFAAIGTWMRASDRSTETVRWSQRLGLPAAGLYLLALLCKASVIPLPAVLLGIAHARRGRLVREDFVRVAPIAALAAVFVPVTLWFHQMNALSDGTLAARPFLERVGGAAWAWIAYLERAFVPVRLGFVYPAWPVVPSDPRFFVPAAAVVAGAVALWRARFGWATTVRRALAYHAAMTVPVLGFVEMSYFRVGPVSNHLQYLALAGPAALLGAAAAGVAGRWGRRTAWLAGTAMAGAFTVLTVSRSLAFEDDLSLWTAAVQAAPESGFARRQLALTLSELRRSAEARDQFEVLAERAREPADRHLARAALALQDGRWASVASEAELAWNANPDAVAHAEVGVELARRGRPVEAAGILARVVRYRPRDGASRYWYGASLVRLGRLAEAEQILRDGCLLDARDVRLGEALGLVLVHSGRIEDARAQLIQGVGLDAVEADARITEWSAQAPRR
jgi:protein O-mannosyl-transferase